MKKIQMLLIPLLSLGFLTSCWDDPTPGPGPGPTPVDHTVTQEEFERAVSFKGVKYMQVTGEEIVKKKESVKLDEYSPSVYHSFEDGYMGYYDIFIKDNKDGTYSGAKKTSKEDMEYEEISVSSDEFKTPESDNYLFEFLKNAGLDSIESFNYDEGEECYSAIGEGQTINKSEFKLKFNNKLLVYMSCISINKYQSDIFEYAYEQKTPEFPNI